MSVRLAGMALGIALATVWIVLGFAEMLLVGLGGAVGYVIAGGLAGELDLPELVRRLGSRRE